MSIKLYIIASVQDIKDIEDLVYIHKKKYKNIAFTYSTSVNINNLRDANIIVHCGGREQSIHFGNPKTFVNLSKITMEIIDKIIKIHHASISKRRFHAF